MRSNCQVPRKNITVGEMGQIYSGGTPSTSDPSFWNGSIHWATPTEITRLNSKYISNTTSTITEKGLAKSSAVLLPVRSLLICTRATIGEIAINLIPIATNQGFKNLAPTNEFVPEFVYHLLKFHKHLLVRLANGSTFLELSKSDLSTIRLPVPEKSEQEKIANVLNACDSQIELLHAKIDKLKQQKKGLMQRLLTGEVRVNVA